jgi:glyoxylase-like metal-dependent hydrolase (beta-lactamase superfamily II)
VPSRARRVGAVEIVSLLDATVLAGGPATDGFPGGAAEVWAEARRRHPSVFDGDRWRLPVRCTLLRSGGRTILVDTGVGPQSAPAFAWSETRGGLPDELAAAGVAPADVEVVVITHVHDDHLGWNVVEGSADPLFANARYLVHRADWELMSSSQDEEDREIFHTALAPLERANVIELSGERAALADGLLLVHAPGHTPGHQVVLVDSQGERAIVTGDLVNHPVQLLQPGVNGTTDLEPERAAATRGAFLDRIEREGRLVVPTHLPEPFGHIEGDGARWVWRGDAEA